MDRKKKKWSTWIRRQQGQYRHQPKTATASLCGVKLAIIASDHAIEATNELKEKCTSMDGSFISSKKKLSFIPFPFNFISSVDHLLLPSSTLPVAVAAFLVFPSQLVFIDKEMKLKRSRSAKLYSKLLKSAFLSRFFCPPFHQALLVKPVWKKKSKKKTFSESSSQERTCYGKKPIIVMELPSKYKKMGIKA